MTKSPKEPKELFQGITTDFREVFSDDLISIILYGSATGPDYRPGTSDINFLLALSEEGIDDLERSFDVLKKWRRKGMAVPLFLTETYINSSLDVFPIEYLNLQRNHVLVYGKDILAPLAFRREHLRLQCEREIKGKLLLLREAFLETEGRGKELKAVVRDSIKAFVSIFEALLFLMDKELPAAKRDILKATCAEFEMDGALFEELMNIKEGVSDPGTVELRKLFKKYISQIRELSKHVDQLGG